MDMVIDMDMDTEAGRVKDAGGQNHEMTTAGWCLLALPDVA